VLIANINIVLNIFMIIVIQKYVNFMRISRRIPRTNKNICKN